MNDIKDHNTRSRLGSVGIYLVMIFFTVMALYPLFWLVVSSFKTTTEFQMNKLGFPKKWVTINYKDAWVRGKFPMLIVNSVIYTGITTLAISSSAPWPASASQIRHKAAPILYGSFVIGIL